MRQSQKGNRARNKSSRKPSGPSINRVYESSGPEGKVRGTPQQIIEKYQSLARDKSTAGDRVLAESFLQHAEHYMRILTAAQASHQQRREEREEREEEEPEVERDEGEARGEAAADALAVIDGDDGGAEIVATPESMSQPQRQPRRRDDDGEDGQRRRPRRNTRKPRETASDDAPAPSPEAAGDAPSAEASEDAPTSRRAKGRGRPSGLDVIDAPEGGDDGDDWPATSAVGHA